MLTKNDFKHLKTRFLKNNYIIKLCYELQKGNHVAKDEYIDLVTNSHNFALLSHQIQVDRIFVIKLELGNCNGNHYLLHMLAYFLYYQNRSFNKAFKIYKILLKKVIM